MKIELDASKVLYPFFPRNLNNVSLIEPRRKRGKIDGTFLAIVLIILAFGLVMLFSASYAYAYYNRGDSLYFIRRQGFFALIGIIAMLAVSQVNYKIIQKLNILLFIGTISLLIIVLFLRDSHGFARWVRIGQMSFQPSEIAKFAIIVMFAQIASTRPKGKLNWMEELLPYIITLGSIAGLVILERHLSGTVIILLIGIAMLWFGGADIKYFLILLAIGAAAVVTVLVVPFFMQYATARVSTWLDPYSNYLGEGYQTIQALIAIGSGGLFGTGIGNSRQKYLYIPEPQNDFIFAVVCEELGFLGAVLVLLLFAFLIWRGFSIARKCPDKFGALLAAGCTMHIGMQVLLNIAVVTNTIPNTGISLPFFSYGGTALLMTLGEMGVVLSVSKNSGIVESNLKTEEEK